MVRLTDGDGEGLAVTVGPADGDGELVARAAAAAGAVPPGPLAFPGTDAAAVCPVPRGAPCAPVALAVARGAAH